MNPFKYGQVVSAKDFCPRPKLVKQLSGYIGTGQNVVLQGERRVGKTSLVYETVRRAKGCRMLYVDLMEIKTIDDLCKRMVTAVISLERQAGFVEKLLKSLAQLRPTLSIDPLTGEPSISLDAGVKLRTESIDALLDLVRGMNKRKPLVAVLDEFQSILNLPGSREALAALRSKIQFHSEVPYVFAGSVREDMLGLFTDPESPFFKSAVAMDVGPLEPDAFVRFLTEKFQSGKRTITEGILGKVIEIADHIPGDVQALCSCLWDCTDEGATISETQTASALELIYAREAKVYEADLARLTGQQLKCLTGLARMGGRAPLSAEFLKGVGIPLPASVKKALTRLLHYRILYRHRGEYRFVNPFFRSWLIWKNY